MYKRIKKPLSDLSHNFGYVIFGMIVGAILAEFTPRLVYYINKPQAQSTYTQFLQNNISFEETPF